MAVENIRSDYLTIIGGGISPKSPPKFPSPVISVEPKRKAAPEILAWTAFVKYIKETRPEAFVGVRKESDKLEVVKRISADNTAAYKTFMEEWNEKYQAARGGGGGGEESRERKSRRTKSKKLRKHRRTSHR